MKKPKKVGIYYLKFLDHTHSNPGAAGPYMCEVFGVMYKQDKFSYYIASWIAAGDLEDCNNEVFTILKSTVLEKKRLK